MATEEITVVQRIISMGGRGMLPTMVYTCWMANLLLAAREKVLLVKSSAQTL